MNYQEFERRASQVDGTCFVYDSPRNRGQYGFGQKWEALDLAATGTEFEIVPISDYPWVKEIMMNNYKAEMAPASNVIDEGFDEMMAAFHNDSLYLGIWQVDDETTYMLIYGYNPLVEDRIRIGNRIAAIRKEQGMTQTQLAEKCGMHQSNIARIENGRYGITVDVLARIAQALGKEIDLV